MVQSVEASASNSGCCRFESYYGHQCYLSVMGAPELVYLGDLDRNQEVVPIDKYEYRWAAETVVLRRTVNPFPKGNTGGSNPSPPTII